MKKTKLGPVVLVIWDGFGISKKKDHGDATRAAKMPTWQALQKSWPNSKLVADGEAVGLHPHQTGNTEAGHATIGAGRPVESDHLVIDAAIDDGSFQTNPALLSAAEHVKKNGSTLHLMGLLTEENSGHASQRHMQALIQFVKEKGVKRAALHLFTDGRDTPPFRAQELVLNLEKTLPKNFVIATVTGRFYAMDRDRRWNRTLLAYNAIVSGEGVMADSASRAISQAYNRGEYDEIILPSVICREGTCVAPVKDNDVIIFWNLRSDRARQLTKPFVEKDFEHAEPHAPKRSATRKNLYFVTLTEFGKGLDHAIAAFPHREVENTLPETLRHMHQLYAAESEKFAAITYFFNGGYDAPRYDEKRLIVPSPKNVAGYDETPRMSADKLTHDLLKHLPNFDFIAVNYANADMVGHTGNFAATVKACETLDDTLAKLWSAVRKLNGILIVTADHGNAEQTASLSGGKDTEHNPNPVPFLIAGASIKKKRVKSGSLADIAPTILDLFGIPKPKAMSGKSLLK